MPSPAFTHESVLPVLRAACEQAGVSAAGAVLLRLGENAIWRLARDPLVVRISREAERLPVVRKELCVARWLGTGGVPAVRVADEVPGQPMMVSGHPVSFWRLADGDGPEPSQKDLARLLKSFHALDEFPCDLPEFDPFPVSRSRIANARAIGEKDQDFLLGVCGEAEEILAGLDFALPRGAIHGAHVANLLADRGRVVLLDFESSVVGPREWDLLPAGVGVDRFGRDEGTYRDFTEAYGFDVREWAGYPKLRRVRELTMTTWMAQNAGNSEKLHAEAKRRISSLREGEFKRAWCFF